jgi:YD repeat-containing protein
MLDEICLYTRPLSLADVQAIYAAGAAGKTPLPSNIAPTICFTSPPSGTSYVVGTPITLGTLANDTDGTIAKVEFFDGTTKLGETTASAPGQPQAFNFTINAGLSFGLHVLTAHATDNAGATTASGAVRLPITSVRPVVVITTPAGNEGFATGQSILVQATATYALGTIAKVEFFDGGAKLAESTTPVVGSPSTYAFTQTAGLGAGTHTLAAKATATDGEATLSSPVTITVTIVLPSVVLTSPVDNSSMNVGAALTLRATATYSPGSIAKVEFFDGSTKLGELTTPDSGQPSTFTLILSSGLTAGSHVLTAKATAAASGTSATSAPVNVTAGLNTGPVLSDLKFNGAAVPAVIDSNGTFSVTATDPEGVQHVEFRLDGQLLADDTTPGDGFSAPFVLRNVSVGPHTLTVLGWDSWDTPSATALSTAIAAAMPPPPAAPTALVATAISSTQVALTWQGDLTAAGLLFEIERKTGASGTFTLLATVAATTGHLDATAAATAQYSYRIRARDFVDQTSGYSNEASVTMPALGQADLPVSTIKLWLRADAGLTVGPVALWSDQSGNSKHATQTVATNQPLLVQNAVNGRAAVRFDGANDYFNVADFMSNASAGEMFVLLKARVVPGDRSRVPWSFGLSDGSVYPGGSKLYDDFGSATQWDLGAPTQDLTGYHVYNASSQTDEWIARLDGGLLFRSGVNTVGFRTNPMLGRTPQFSDNYFFDGDIAEVLVFDHVLSRAERQTVENYFFARYAVALPTPLFVTAPGFYVDQVAVSLTTSTPGADLYYTLDGSDPTPATSAHYAAPINVTQSTRIRAIASVGGKNSSTSEAIYSIGVAPSTATATSGLAAVYYQTANFGGTSVQRIDPAIDFPNSANGTALVASSGSVRWTGSVIAQYDEVCTFSIKSDGAPRLWIGNTLVIDGSAQTSYQEVTGTIALEAGQTYPLRVDYVARDAVQSATERVTLSWSGLSIASEVVPTRQLVSGLAYPVTVATPVASPAGGNFADNVTITLTASSPAGARVYYTLSGDDPTQAAVLYTDPIVLRQSATLKARAFATGCNDSGLLLAAYTLDNAGPTLANVTFNGQPAPATLTTSGTFGVTATDSSGVKHVAFRLDGQLLADDTIVADGFTASFVIDNIADGPHSLTIQGWDNLDTPSTVMTVPVIVAYPAPPAPVITSPASGQKFNQPTLTVRGTAQPGSAVTVYRGATVLGTGTAGANGVFAIGVTLNAGTNDLFATAQNRNPQPSPTSVVVQAIYDNTLPNPPTALTAQARAGGTIALTWFAPASGLASGYYLFRSSQPIEGTATLNPSQALGGGMIWALAYTDTPPSEGHYYYRAITAYTVGEGVTVSTPSNQADAVADATPPSATVALQAMSAHYDPVGLRFGTGLVQATLTTSEPLGTTPFFNLSVASGVPIFVNLTPSGTNTYTGVFAIDSGTSSGTVGAVFSAIDAAGNRGAAVTLTTPAIIDTAGPKAVTLAPVHITGAGAIESAPPFTNIKNDPVPPDTAVTVAWLITFDEAPKPGVLPAISASLSHHPGLSVPTTVSDAGDTDPRTWAVQLTLPSVAGADTEDLVLQLSVQDDLDNLGGTIVPPHHFQVYKGNLPPLAVPSGLIATALPAGAIQLTWQPVTGATAYVLQVKAPGAVDFSDLSVLSGATAQYAYTPAADGIYAYHVASVRSENGQDATSAFSGAVSVRSDSLAPPAPTDLALEVIAQGVKVTWVAPTTNAADVAGYDLYRSSAAITDVSGLTPAVGHIPADALIALDSQPSPTAPYYALVACDLAGNRSTILSGFANVSLLPVRTLNVTQTDTNAPVLSWDTAPGSVIDGYNVLVDGTPVAVNGVTLLPPGTLAYADTAYAGGERHYAVRTVSGPDNRERDLLLPAVTLTLDAAAEIKRGLMNALPVNVHNVSSTPLIDSVVVARVAGRDQTSAGLVTVAPGATVAFPVVVGGYDDLPGGSAAVSLTLLLTPNDGERVTIARTAQVKIAEGSLTSEILPGEFTRGGAGTVRIKLTNPSALPIEFKVARQNGSQPSDEVRLNVIDPQGVVLSTTPVRLAVGDNLVVLPDGTTVARVPAGGSYTSPSISVPVPLTAPALVNVLLEIDSVYYNFGQPGTQVQLKGPRSQAQVFTLETSYRAEVTSVSPAESNGNTPIVIGGRAVWRGLDPAQPSSLAPNVPVVVFVEIGDFVRQQSVTTDGAGAFSYTFQPGVAEQGGVYSMWATHPNATTPPDTRSTFTIRRVVVSPQEFTVSLPRNYRHALPVSITTGPGTTVQNVRAERVGVLPAAVSIDAGTLATVSPAQTLTLPLSIVGLAATPDSTPVGDLSFNVVSDTPSGPHTWATLSVHYGFSDACPVLQVNPTQLTLGVQPQQVTSASVVLKNTGFAPLEDLNVSLVGDGTNPVPDWVRLQTPAALGLLDIGAEQSVTVAVAPPASSLLVDQIYYVYIRVQGSNTSAPQDIPVTITVSPAGKGGLLLHVVDPYFQLTLPDGAANPNFNGVVGASVSLEKESSTGISTESRSAATDANGELRLDDLSAGRYQLRIAADRHEPYTRRVTIQPGLIAAEQIQLAYNPVSFTWDVVPVTFQDRYQLVLTTTFETNVPVPVVVVEPSSISLPQMCAGQVLNGEFRVSNHGLIDASDFVIATPPSDENFSYEILPGFGNVVRAGESITVAYRVTCLKPLPGECPTAADSTVAAVQTRVSARSMAEGSSGRAVSPRVMAADGGGSPRDKACGLYAAYAPMGWVSRCSNGQSQGGASAAAFTVASGGCGPDAKSPGGYSNVKGCFNCGGLGGPGAVLVTAKKPSSGGGSTNGCFPHPRAGGNGGGGPIGGGNGGGNSGDGDPCSDPCCSGGDGGGGAPGGGGSGGGSPPPPPGGPFSSPGSWVDLIMRQYVDRVDDLSVPVPGGNFKLWREYRFRRWTFHLTDDLFAIHDSSSGASSLVLNNEEYGRVGKSGNASAISAALCTLSSVPAGEYLWQGIGLQKIVKQADGSFYWTNGQGAVRYYDPTGHLTSITAYGNLLVSFEYDAQGYPSAVRDRHGRVVLAPVYSNGLLAQASDSSGRTVSYAYDTNGRLAGVTAIDGSTTAYAYDNWWHLTSRRVHLPGTPDASDHIESIEYYLYEAAALPTTPDGHVLPGHPQFDEKIHGQVTKVSHNYGTSFSYIYNYDSAERTYYARVTSSAGNEEESVMDAAGKLISRTVNGSPVYRLEYDDHTQIVTRGQDQRTIEEFNERNLVVRRTYPDGAIERFEYDPAVYKIARFTDPTGVVTAYTYDNLGNKLTKTEAVGTPLQRVTTSTYYPGTTLLQQRTDPSGRRTAYTYDASDRLTLVYDPDRPAQQTSYTYDSNGNKETETDAMGRIARFRYDALGHVVERTDALQQKTLFTYVGDQLVEVETGKTDSARGRILRYEYDAGGRKTKDKRVAADGTEVVFKTYAYDADGHLISVINALGQGDTYSYDAPGNLTSVSQPDADGRASANQRIYDALNRPTDEIDRAGNKRTTQYDQRDRPVVVTEAVGTPVERSTRTRYDLLGRVIEINQSDVREPARVYTTTYSYDALGRRTAIGGNRVYAVTRTYDAADRIATETDALNRVTSYQYDARDRVVSVQLNGATIASYTYDLVGNRLSVTDGEGNHRHFHYDALDRLIHESIPLPASQSAPADWWTQNTCILKATTYTTWGEMASQTSYTHSGSALVATTTFAYDLFGRKVSDTDPAGLTRSYTYDAADNVVTVSYPPVVSSGDAQPTSVTYLRSPNNCTLIDAVLDRAGQATHYTYDNALYQTDATNSLGGVTHRTFDALGRVASQTDPANNTTTYEYDLFDQPVKITYPDHVAGTHERIATMNYDSHGKLLQKVGAGDYPMSYGYDDVGNLISMTDANGRATRWSYNVRNRVVSKTYADNSVWSYTYDPAGRVATRRDVMGRTTTYTHNAYDLVSTVTYPTDAPVAFTYDQQGRRLSMADGSGTTTWTYDAAGRLATETQSRSGRTLHFSYDTQSQRTGLEIIGGGAPWQTAYGYDNAGRLRTVLDDRLPAGQPYIYT